MKDFCFICYLEQFSREKIFDDEFIRERKNEFYPEEEFGNYVKICERHFDECLEFSNKNLL